MKILLKEKKRAFKLFWAIRTIEKIILSLIDMIGYRAQRVKKKK
jgi:hypothetical protein